MRTIPDISTLAGYSSGDGIINVWGDHASIKAVTRAMKAYNWEHVAQIGTENIDGDTRSFEEHEANARLIAAAPDLLDALKEAEQFIGKTSGGGETDFRAKLNAVIAKAGA